MEEENTQTASFSFHSDSVTDNISLIVLSLNIRTSDINDILCLFVFFFRDVFRINYNNC